MNCTILNVQRYSIHDGDGIRTTVFFKGCPLECKWCHNPESQRYCSEILYNSEKCTACGKCVMVCPQHGICSIDGQYPVPREMCIGCEACSEHCFHGAKEMAGKSYSTDELMKEIAKDRMFYEESGGGVTLSGGEVMTQDMDYLMRILKACDKQGFRVNIDTCGHVGYERFEKVFPYVDTFLYDMKHMDDAIHKHLTGAGNKLILDNLKKISDQCKESKAQGKKAPKINIRTPLIDGINSDDENIEQMLDYLADIDVHKINLLPYHKTGKSKYERIGMVYEGEEYKEPTRERMEEIRDRFIARGYQTVIGG